VELTLNQTHQLLLYADDVNLLGDNIDTIKKNTETDTSKEADLGVTAEKNRLACAQMWEFQILHDFSHLHIHKMS
jgi:hypothetical protein